jgi:putative Mg2+ transporter-C (MgtC) family protein
VQGLTTAAGLWLVAAIGLCAGSGMYPESIYVTMLGLLALTVLRILEDKKVLRRRVEITFDTGLNAEDPLGAIEAQLPDLGATALDFDYQKDNVGNRTSLSFYILFPEGLGLARLVSVLGAVEGVREVQVRVP